MQLLEFASVSTVILKDRHCITLLYMCMEGYFNINLPGRGGLTSTKATPWCVTIIHGLPHVVKEMEQLKI